MLKVVKKGIILSLFSFAVSAEVNITNKLRWQNIQSEISLNYLSLQSSLQIEVTEYSNIEGKLKLHSSDTEGMFQKQHKAEVEELFWTWAEDDFNVKVGKQKITWSQMDSLTPMELISARDFHQSILLEQEDTNIGQWMVNWNKYNTDSNWQVLLMLNPSVHELPSDNDHFALKASKLRFGFPYQPSLELSVQQEKPKNISFATKWQKYYDGFELSTGMKYGADYSPTAQLLVLESSEPPTLYLQYSPYLSLISSTSIQLDSTVLRAEVIYSPNRMFATNTQSALGKSREEQWLIAAAVDFNGPFDSFVNAQLLIDHISSPHVNQVRDATELISTLTISKKFINEQLTAKFSAYVSQEEDSLIKFDINYLFTDELEINLGVADFYGDHEGVFGQYQGNNRAYFQMNYYF